MAKIPLSVRINPTIKAWIERKARRLSTTENWIVEQALIQMAGDEIPRSFDLSKPERRK